MNFTSFFDFDVFGDIFSVRIEIEQNGRKQVQNLQAPQKVLEQQFVALIQDAARSSIPTKITMSHQTDIYNEVQNKYIENSITFMNNSYCDKNGTN
jgi:hypothetical protein